MKISGILEKNNYPKNSMQHLTESTQQICRYRN